MAGNWLKLRSADKPKKNNRSVFPARQMSFATFGPALQQGRNTCQTNLLQSTSFLRQKQSLRHHRLDKTTCLNRLLRELYFFCMFCCCFKGILAMQLVLELNKSALIFSGLPDILDVCLSHLSVTGSIVSSVVIRDVFHCNRAECLSFFSLVCLVRLCNCLR